MLFVVRLILIVFLLLVSQATWVPHISIFGVTPDLFLGVVFLLTLKRGIGWGVWTGVVLGLLIDVEQPERLGLSSLAFTLAAVGVDLGARSFERTNPIVLFVLFFLTALLAQTVRAVWLSAGDPGSFLGTWSGWAFPGALYTALFVPPLSWLAARVIGSRDWILHAA